MLAFAGVKPGDKVADFMMGSGYFTRILAPAVGPNGEVYGYQSAEFVKFRAAYGEEQKAAVADYPNAVTLTAPLATRSEAQTSDLQSLMLNSYALFCLNKQKRTFHD